MKNKKVCEKCNHFRSVSVEWDEDKINYCYLEMEDNPTKFTPVTKNGYFKEIFDGCPNNLEHEILNN